MSAVEIETYFVSALDGFINESAGRIWEFEGELSAPASGAALGGGRLPDLITLPLASKDS